ncbi:hypothetical protein [Nonomuraea endophytica]|uniref:Uncharacterized protein n=1 Tax=Nonomuraea endophytica TaxID=714136 RepID=A0A7W7ZYV6_9ACTN|nr:hypothetical protein [Nonomuraea endophytica]MBB5076357.1 hypothetical protein [Nonomuraea endophytica]
MEEIGGNDVLGLGDQELLSMLVRRSAGGQECRAVLTTRSPPSI